MKQPFEHGAQVITIDGGSVRIPVLAVGKGWMVVDKPAGMSVHNEPGRDLCSLASVFIQEETSLGERVEMNPDYGVHPVHRLDKETSGVLLLAVTRKMFRFFSSQFESRKVKKWYVAILHGRLENPEGDDGWGTWNWALAKTAGGRQNPEGDGPRLDSRTRYRVLGHSAHYTMVEIELLSGRTHQIRRHAKLSGHQVAGDARYGSNRAVSYLRSHHGFDRLALHARGLTLLPPGGREPETFETPTIPIQMRELFENDPAFQ
jgi:23S rRNA-/tRNA-specific pseudouridylate synthase